MALAVVGGSFLSGFLQVLFDRLASREVVDFFRRKELDDSLLKKLKMRLLAVNAVLDDAEEKQITNPAVREWLDELKDAVYRAEDLLDEIATDYLLCKLESDVWKFTFKSINPFDEGIEDKVAKIIGKLENIVEQKDLLSLKEVMGGKRSQRLPTTSLVNDSDVYGRDEDKDAMINLLKSDDACDNEICVITLVGIGGIGKTTLAQLVYNDDRVKDFKLKAWVCVSEEFDVLRVTKTILEAVTSLACDINDLNMLQVRLKESLAQKKFLLVLDDVWNGSYIDWDVLQSPFRSAKKGSKIIVTTRNKSVASIMRTTHTHYLKELPYEECWKLFKRRAFGNGIPSVANPSLEAIGKEIVKKCKGLPLAAKTLGSLLFSKVGAEEWVNVLNSEIWDLPNDKSNILPTLRLSYYYLPSHLKRCFAYCSIFPKGYEFEKEKLVLLWMAEGFVIPAKNRKFMEEVGDGYFCELLSRSFFQQSSRNKSCFVMHDLINDLAQFVSGEFFFKFENGKLHEVTEKARHLSYLRDKDDVPEKFEALYKVKCLRTFLPSNYSSAQCHLSNMVSHDLLPQLECLRVLSLPHYSITGLPDPICNLKHLRYLDLSHTLIQKLPELTSSLCNLQTLMLSGCTCLTVLPTNMHNLINLRHLDISGTNLKEMPVHLSRLRSLQTLSTFVVSRRSGSKISELGKLLHLHGKLTILELQNVVSATDASEANLNDKKYLEELVFKWNTDIRDFQNVTDVLDKLRPNENLRRLTIKCYGGTKFPDWLGNSSFFNLEFLCLDDCESCLFLPPLGQLTSLRELSITKMSGIKTVRPEFYRNGFSSIKPFGSLEILKFNDMPMLKCFSFGGDGGEFLKLQELYIQRCPNLTGNLPDHLPSLAKLVISGCQKLVASLPRVPSLRELMLHGCDALKSLPEEMMHGNTCLQQLKIDGCLSLMSFPRGGLPSSLISLHINECKKLEFQLPDELMHHYTALECLHIEKSCDSLKSLPLSFFTKLQDLHIRNCENLEFLCIQEELHEDLICLRNLKIKDCPNLVSFPQRGLPTPNLTSFSVSNCKKLKSMPKCMHQLLASLQRLKLSHCPELVSFPKGGLPSNLKQLSVVNCKNLTPQKEWGLHVMESLSHFNIRGECSNVESFPEEGLLPTTLNTLCITELLNLKSLNHKGLQHLTSLRTLEINGCNSLESMPNEGLSTSISHLIIKDCSLLVPRCQANIGEDWDKISHICNIEVDD